jgi:hypothetical protein
MKTLDSVLKHFSNEKVTDEIKKQRLLHLENRFKDMATDIMEYASNDDNRLAALRYLLQAKWAAIHSVTHGVPEVK